MLKIIYIDKMTVIIKYDNKIILNLKKYSMFKFKTQTELSGVDDFG